MSELGVLARFPFSADPVIKVPTLEQIQAIVREHGAKAPSVLREIERKRCELRVKRASDPFRYGYVPPIWGKAERLLWTIMFLVLFGANRSSKTFFAVWAAVRHMVQDPGAKVLFLHNDERQSIDVHQQIFWHYLPREWKPAPGKRTRTGDAKISYQEGDGFAGGVVVLPNGSRALFGNYKQDFTRFEGSEYTLINASEKFPLPLLETLGFRLPGQGKVLRLLWDYSPIHGIEPSIDRVMNGAATIESERAPHLPSDHRAATDQDWPLGNMPRLQEGVIEGLRIMYFWSEDNALASGEALREKMVREKWDIIVRERRMYGFARNVLGKVLPKFRKTNIVALAADERPHPCEEYDQGAGCTRCRAIRAARFAQSLLKDACRRMVYDPAGGRNPFMTWFAMDRHDRHLLYREWPDKRRFGEWATSSSSETKWNGDIGPAQEKLGLSVAEQKRLILEAEGWRWEGKEYVWAREGVAPEFIVQRLIDPRAGAAQRQAENEDQGQTLIDIFEEEQRDANGNLIGPSMIFEPAPGQQEDHGIDVINTKYLGYDESKPIEPLINEPRFYVAEECEQSTHALLNYRAGRPKTDQACKDPFDNVRYYFTSEPFYVAAGGIKSAGIKGGYRG
jgi:hypothetical protein